MLRWLLVHWRLAVGTVIAVVTLGTVGLLGFWCWLDAKQQQIEEDIRRELYS